MQRSNYPFGTRYNFGNDTLFSQRNPEGFNIQPTFGNLLLLSGADFLLLDGTDFNLL